MKIQLSKIIALTKKAQDELAQLKIAEDELRAAEENKKNISIKGKKDWEKELEKWSKKYFGAMLDSALNGNFSINLVNISHYGRDYLDLNGFQVFKLDLASYTKQFNNQYEILNHQITALRNFFEKNSQLTANAIGAFNLKEILKKIPKKIGAGDSINFEFIQDSVNQSHFISEALDAPIEKIDSIHIKLRELDMHLHLIKESFKVISTLKRDLEEQGINPFILSNNGIYYAISWSGGLVNDSHIEHPFRDILTLQKISSQEGQNYLNHIQEEIVKNANNGLAELYLANSSIINPESHTHSLTPNLVIDVFSHLGFSTRKKEGGILISWTN